MITRCLENLLAGSKPGEVEVIVVCNGCRDRTAELARQFGGQVQVIETDTPSKTNALNLGDRAAEAFPRIYVDADVVMSLESARLLVAAIETKSALSVAPSVETVFPPGTSPWVKAYYRLWMALPYIQEGMMAAGVYAVGEEGRRRFGEFPDIISDDGYFRLQFRAGERVEVPAALSRVTAPGNLGDLIRIKTRSRLGVLQIRERFPELFSAEQATKQYGKALLHVLARPSLYLGVLPYIYVNVVALRRSRKQAATLERYVWERDNSSRGPQPASAP